MKDDPESPAQAPDLAAQLLGRFDIENQDNARCQELLSFALTRMMDSPKAREVASTFIAEDMKATLRFEAFNGERPEFGNDGILFGAVCALSSFTDGQIVVTLHEAYLTADHDWRTSEVPEILCHELFGHGLWLARGSSEKSYQAIHHHELNEINARLLGWIVECELTGRVRRGSDIRRYLADPTAFTNRLKLRLPYYALTFSSAEMMEPEKALEARIAQSRAKKAELVLNQRNQRSWSPVIDHFVGYHGIAEQNVTVLRRYMAREDRYVSREIDMVGDVTTELESTLERFRAEADKVSTRYLQWAADCPLIKDLRCETDANDRRLRELMDGLLDNPAALPAEVSPIDEPAVWEGQITFDDLVAMYRHDREENPDHWTAP